MKRPHILDMDADEWVTLCGVDGTWIVCVSRSWHERHPERTCGACRAAYEGRK